MMYTWANVDVREKTQIRLAPPFRTAIGGVM